MRKRLEGQGSNFHNLVRSSPKPDLIRVGGEESEARRLTVVTKGRQPKTTQKIQGFLNSNS